MGDRGTNWMYEGSLAAKDDSYNAKAVAEEDAKNEAFLLGKAYVPDGAQQHSGDFVLASAGMSGALEKASTMGAAIGGVGNNSNSNVVDGMSMGMGMSMGATTYQIQDDTTKMTTTVATTTTANTYDDNISNNNEWNTNFHLHEDPMYAVHQQQNAQRKDIEKKKRLMERAGLEIQMQPPVIGDSRSNGGDGRKMSGMPPEVDSAAKRGDEEDDKRRTRRQKINVPYFLIHCIRSTI